MAGLPAKERPPLDTAGAQRNHRQNLHPPRACQHRRAQQPDPRPRMAARRALEGCVMNDAINLEPREALRRFKPHPAYKDSGIEWLGKIPAHWEVKRLKRLFRVVNG